MLLATDFLGSWTFERQIDDRLGHQQGWVHGQARFTAEGDLIRYHEQGALRIGDGPIMTAERSYLWRFGENVEVMFDDGRPFHEFAPTGEGQGSDHFCGEDMYRVVYDFTNWPGWSSTYVVTGPRKDYTSRTVFKRRG